MIIRIPATSRVSRGQIFSLLKQSCKGLGGAQLTQEHYGYYYAVIDSQFASDKFRAGLHELRVSNIEVDLPPGLTIRPVASPQTSSPPSGKPTTGDLLVDLLQGLAGNNPFKRPS